MSFSTEHELGEEWMMNFSACCNDTSRKYMDNTNNRAVLVHPLFLPSAVEIMSVIGTIYNAGFTKEDFTKHPFLHHIMDIEFMGQLTCGGKVISTAKLVKTIKKRNGLHVGVAINHCGEDGEILAKGHFGGVIIGYNNAKFPEKEEFSPERLPFPKFFDGANEIITLKIPSTQAHMFDACVRDPKVPRKPSANLNPHTNLKYAIKSGLPARTLNGLSLLGLAFTAIMKKYFPGQDVFIKRICCTFSAPIFIHQDVDEITASVYVNLSSLEKEGILYFQVKKGNDIVLKNGAIVLSNTFSSKI